MGGMCKWVCQMGATNVGVVENYKDMTPGYDPWLKQKVSLVSGKEENLPDDVQ